MNKISFLLLEALTLVAVSTAIGSDSSTGAVDEITEQQVEADSKELSDHVVFTGGQWHNPKSLLTPDSPFHYLSHSDEATWQQVQQQHQKKLQEIRALPLQEPIDTPSSSGIQSTSPGGSDSQTKSDKKTHTLDETVEDIGPFIKTFYVHFFSENSIPVHRFSDSHFMAVRFSVGESHFSFFIPTRGKDGIFLKAQSQRHGYRHSNAHSYRFFRKNVTGYFLNYQCLSSQCERLVFQVSKPHHRIAFQYKSKEGKILKRTVSSKNRQVATILVQTERVHIQVQTNGSASPQAITWAQHHAQWFHKLEENRPFFGLGKSVSVVNGASSYRIFAQDPLDSRGLSAPKSFYGNFMLNWDALAQVSDSEWVKKHHHHQPLEQSQHLEITIPHSVQIRDNPILLFQPKSLPPSLLDSMSAQNTIYSSEFNKRGSGEEQQKEEQNGFPDTQAPLKNHFFTDLSIRGPLYFRKGLHSQKKKVPFRRITLGGTSSHGALLIDLSFLAPSSLLRKTGQGFSKEIGMAQNGDRPQTHPEDLVSEVRLIVRPERGSYYPKQVPLQISMAQFRRKLDEAFTDTPHNHLLEEVGINPKAALLRHHRPYGDPDREVIKNLLVMESELNTYRYHPRVEDYIYGKKANENTNEVKSLLPRVCSQYIPLMAPLRKIIRNSFMHLKVTPSFAHILPLESTYLTKRTTDEKTGQEIGLYNSHVFAETTTATGMYQLLDDTAKHKAGKLSQFSNFWPSGSMNEASEDFQFFSALPEKCPDFTEDSRKKCLAPGEYDDRVYLEPASLLAATYFRFLREEYFSNDSTLLPLAYHDGQGTILKPFNNQHKGFPRTLELLNDFIGYKSIYQGDDYVFRYLAVRMISVQPHHFCKDYGFDSEQAMDDFYSAQSPLIDNKKMSLFRPEGPILRENHELYQEQRQ